MANLNDKQILWHGKVFDFREPLIIPNLSLPLCNKYGVNSSGSPVISKACEFLLEFTPMKIGAGMTFLEVALKVTPLYSPLITPPSPSYIKRGKKEGGVRLGDKGGLLIT